MNVNSDATGMKAATRGFRKPKAAGPTPMLSTTKVGALFPWLVERNQSTLTAIPPVSRSAVMSRMGGWPNMRLYSRLNWLALS